MKTFDEKEYFYESNLLDRHFACLTAGDVIAIHYNDKVYELCVLETKPGNAVSIIECDMNVDFASPVGYQEQHRREEQYEELTDGTPESELVDQGFCAFQGQGHRIDGKEKNTQAAPQKIAANGRQRGVPNYNHDVYNLQFYREKRRNREQLSQQEADIGDFKAFQGEGRSLRSKKIK